MRSSRLLGISILLGGSMLAASMGFAHGANHHAPKAAAPADAPVAPEPAAARVNEAYLAQVKPIFEKKCFDCHSNSTRYPWYHQVPGVKWLIDHDVAEGREHLDFTNGFPFAGHGSPGEDLDAIKEEVSEGEMPPLLYRVAHRDSALTEAEIKRVVDWVIASKAILGNEDVSKR